MAKNKGVSNIKPEVELMDSSTDNGLTAYAKLLLPSVGVALAMRTTASKALKAMGEALESEDFDLLDPNEKVDIAERVLKATTSDPNNNAALISEIGSLMDKGADEGYGSAIHAALENADLPEMRSARSAIGPARTTLRSGEQPVVDHEENVVPLSTPLKSDYRT